MKKIIFTALTILLLFLSSVIKGNDKELEFVEVKAMSIEEVEEVVEIVQTPTPQLTPDPIEVALQEVEKRMSEIEMIEDKMEWFIAYKEIINDYYGVLDPPETIYDYFTEDEIILICRVVETETYDQDFMSKVNVANVVLNRYYDGRFGETITEIVTSPKQFAYGRKKITEDTILAVEYAFEIEDTTNGAIFFHSNSKIDTFCGAKYIFSDSAVHHFYK